MVKKRSTRIERISPFFQVKPSHTTQVKTVHRKGYHRKDGAYVKPTDYVKVTQRRSVNPKQARNIFGARSDRSRSVDLAKQASKIVEDERWSKSPNRFDYPFVDTMWQKEPTRKAKKGKSKKTPKWGKIGAPRSKERKEWMKKISKERRRY